MSTDPNLSHESVFGEAPASWNTSYVTPDGFICRITLRGETGKDLLDKAGSAIAFLLEHGCKPEKQHSQASKGGTKVCPIHQAEMKRFEKNGKAWFSHKLEDGAWCNGQKK